MREEVDTRGMTANTYDAERDIAEAEIPGQIGIFLANRVWLSRRRREENAVLNRAVDNQERGLPATGRPRRGSREYWKSVARIALLKLPATLPDEWGEAPPREIKRRLGRLRKAGYWVPGYSKMHADELRRTYRGIQGRVRREASRHCPEVLDEIKEGNRDIAQREFEAG
jgi:hypothetical protein